MSDPLHADVDILDRPYCHLHDPRQRDRQVNRPLGIDPALLTEMMGEQSRLRIILIGYPEDVNQEILNLYPCGYAIDAWSPPQRIPHSAEVITVYTKRSRRIS